MKLLHLKTYAQRPEMDQMKIVRRVLTPDGTSDGTFGAPRGGRNACMTCRYADHNVVKRCLHAWRFDVWNPPHLNLNIVRRKNIYKAT